MKFIEAIKKGYAKNAVEEKVEGVKNYVKENPKDTVIIVAGGLLALDILLRLFPGRQHPQINNYIYAIPYKLK